jgi:hypothetical protein
VGLGASAKVFDQHHLGPRPVSGHHTAASQRG